MADQRVKVGLGGTATVREVTCQACGRTAYANKRGEILMHTRPDESGSTTCGGSVRGARP